MADKNLSALDMLLSGAYDPKPSQPRSPAATPSVNSPASMDAESAILSQIADTKKKLNASLEAAKDPTRYLTSSSMTPNEDRASNEIAEYSRKLTDLDQQLKKIRSTGKNFSETNAFRDIPASLISGTGNATFGLASGLYTLGTGDYDNWMNDVNKLIQKGADAVRSQGGNERRQVALEEVQKVADKGMAAEFAETLKQFTANGSLTVNLIAEQIPQFVGSGLLSKAAGKVAAKRAIAKGATLEAAAAKGTKAATGTVIGANAVAQGGDVGQNTYDRLINADEAIWLQDPEYLQAINSGADLEAFKRSRAETIAQTVQAGATALSFITNKYLPTAEKAFVGTRIGKSRVGSAIGTALGETAQEISEEAGGQFLSNLGVRAVDPMQSLGEGVGQSAALAGLAAGPIGGVAGAIAGPVDRGPRKPDLNRLEDVELFDAIDAYTATQPGPGGNLLESPQALDLRTASTDRTINVAGLNLTPRQIIEQAQQNINDGRVAYALSQPVSADQKAELVARIYNREESTKAEGGVVERINPLLDGRTSVSELVKQIEDTLNRFTPEVIDESNVLSGLRDAIAVDESGKRVNNGKAILTTARGAVSQFRPVAPQSQTMTARPERGGDGSVLMTQEEAANEAQRERQSQQAFKLAEARQARYEQQTANTGQREDLRPGAPEPEQQFFLNPDQYGPDLGGTPATVTESTDRAGYVRIQYESPTETAAGQPVIISEEVPAAALMGRVVRGNARMSQELAADQRRLKRGVGTEMAGPRNSVDRTSSKSLTEQQQPDVPMLRPVESNFQRTGTSENTQPQQGELPAPPAQLPAPEAEQDGNTRFSGRAGAAPQNTGATNPNRVDRVREGAPEGERAVELRGRDGQQEGEAEGKPNFMEVIEDRLKRMESMGRQGRIVAARVRALLKNNSLTADQIYYAFRAGDVLSRILPKSASVDIDFVPILTAQNAGAAAASGISVGDEASGFYEVFKITENGFRGLITLSLSENVIDFARENAAHEAFHVIQDILKVYDPQGYAAISQSFKDDMGVDDLDPSILRKLKTLTLDGETSMYDSLKAQYGDGKVWSSYEAQAHAFGALVDALDRGESMKGLKASFIRFVDMLSTFRRDMAVVLGAGGVLTPAELFEGYRTGEYREYIDDLEAPTLELMHWASEQEQSYSGRTKSPPKRTVTAYKLFKVKKSQPGKLFPLFVNAKQEVPVGQWLDADEAPAADSTKTGNKQVKSKLGNLAYRPGWHAGDLPVATHIGGGGAKTRRPDEVWAEVELAADKDWQKEADKRAKRDKNGNIIPKTAQIDDRIPTDGYYRYKTNPNMTGNWLISGSMKVNRILSDAEVKEINDAAGVEDLPREQPFDAEGFGFTRYSGRVRNMASLERTFGMLEKRTFAKGRDLKVFIQERIKPALERAGIDVTDFESEELFNYLVSSVTNDAEYALLENANAIGWYDEKVSKALEVLSLVHPEIATDPKSKFAFVWALAVTSNGLKVNPNFELAEKAYRAYKDTGKMPSDIGIGEAKDAINKSLNSFNTMMDRFGFEELERFMTTKATVKDIESKTGLSISGEGKAEEVFGSAILGPKIGNGFFANLYGYFDQLTMDRWLMRTWGRWTGTLISDNTNNIEKSRVRLERLIGGLSSDDKKKLSDLIKLDVETTSLDDISFAILKASTKKDIREEMNGIAVGNQDFLRSVLGEPKGTAKQVGIGDSIRKAGNALAKYIDGQKEAPAGANERKFIRKVFGKALTTLQKKYPDLTMADLQALLWYPEKRLYEAAKTDEVETGYEDDNAPDYANAAVLVARNAGVGDEQIKEAIQRVDSRRSSNVRSGGAGRGNRGVVSGAAQGQRTEAEGIRTAQPSGAERFSGRGGVRGGAGLLAAQDAAPLQGLPEEVKIPATGEFVKAGPYVPAREVAAEYMRRNGRAYNPPKVYIPVEPERAQRIAAAYDAMQHNPSDPRVKQSYKALARETMAQWEVIKEMVGLKVDFIDGADPYTASPRLVIEDIVNNNHMWVYPTDSGYGMEGITAQDEAENPMLALTDDIISGRRARVNDIFRIVHDFFGHAKEGIGFRARGEENAWLQHREMYSPAARNAMTVETRGQNNWLNYGPYGESNRTASTEDTVFAEQKIGRIAEWVVNEIPDTRFSGRQGQLKQWFGSSKVVDNSGNPLVVYHGTSKDTNFRSFKIGPRGAWFTTNPDEASQYAEENDSQRLVRDDSYGAKPWSMKKVNTASRVIPAYLKVDNPKVYNGNELTDEVYKRGGESYSRGQAALFRDLLAQGFDGIQLKTTTGDVWVVLKAPNQIKSAFNEQFDENDTRFSGRRGRSSVRAALENQLRPMPQFTEVDYNLGGEESGRLDGVVYQLQDKLIDLKRLQQKIERSGKRLSDEANAYRAEELYHGKAAKASQDFINRELNPLLREMRDKNIPLEMMDDFLHARHAKEANAQIRKINPAMNAGSGMTDEQADAYINGLPALRRQQLEALAGKVDAIIQKTQKMLVEYGLEKQETIDTWNKTYKFYVPLQREGFEEDAVGSGSQGVSVRGDTSQRRMGSERGVIDVLANIAMQREKAITRGERNRVGNAVMALALQAPNDSFWFVIDAKTKNSDEAISKLVGFGIPLEDAQNIVGQPLERVIGSDGRVKFVANASFRNNDNVLATRINGEDKFIIFNKRNKESARLVASLKNLDNVVRSEAMNKLGKVTRYFAAINTQYNPAFGLFNLIRDLQGAALNLSNTKLAGKQRQVIAGALPAAMGIYRDLRLERDGKESGGEWVQWAEEFAQEGGKTGFRDNFLNSQERAEAISNELTGGSKARQIAMKTAGPVFEWLSDFNEGIENGVRVSAYRTAREMGIPKAEAASIAKNITVNFNRRGAIGAQAGVWYAFFNASVQGTARMYETLSGPAGKKIIAGGLLIGFTQAIALAAAGLDDLPEWLKDKNLIIPLGDGKYFAFPMPLGFHAIPSIARRSVEFFTNDNNAGIDAVGLLGMLADAYNPIGNAGISLQTIAPTVADPLVALSENKDFAGRAIYNENFNSLDPIPGAERDRAGVSVVGKGIAMAIDRLTGGSGYTAGAFSPTGDAVDYLIGQLTGGVGRLVLNTAGAAQSLAKGEDVPNYKIPVVGRMIGNENEAFSISNRFYDNLKKMKRHQRELEGRMEDGEDVADYYAKNPEAALYEAAGDVESILRKLKKERDALAEADSGAEYVAAMEDARIQAMSDFNQLVEDYKKGQ